MSIKEYLSSKSNSWAPTTLKSVGALLYKYQAAYNTGDPNDLWQAIQPLKPYSRSTVWTHFVSYQKYHSNGTNNSLERFRHANSNWFKNAYSRKAVGISFEEALKRIDTLPGDIRGHARGILFSAQRFSESIQPISPERLILGKGSKLRSDLRRGVHPVVPYHQLYRGLKSIGLAPHQLRKLSLTRAAQNGAQVADLCSIAGWSSISTAIHYLQPQQDERLKGFLG